MASRGGARAAGTDGTDFSARQRVANQIKLSVQMKFYLKGLFALHFFVLLAMWTKVGSEFARRELGWKSPFFDKLDLPSAYSWEYVWCLSFIPIIFGLLSFTHNKARLLRTAYYGQYVFGIIPCSIGLGSQFPELWDYIFNTETSKTPTFGKSFPMVVVWYIFFLIAFQLHVFSLMCSYYLLSSWQRDPKVETKKD